MAGTEERRKKRTKKPKVFSSLTQIAQDTPLSERELAVYFSKIAELKKTEEVLKESEAKFRKVFEEGPFGMAMVDLDYRFFRVNAKLCQMLGYTEEELTKLSFVDISYPDDIDMDIELAQKLYAGEIPSYKIDKRYVRKDGEVVWHSVTATVIRNEAGEPLSFLGMVEDITEQKSVETEREELINKIQLLLESTDQGIFGTDRQGLCTFINRAACEITGHKAEEVLGKNIHKILHHSHSDGSLYPIQECPMHRVALTGKGVRIDTEVFWRKDGTSFPIEYSAYPIIEDDVIKGLVVAFNDITERKRAEELSKALNDINSAISSVLGFDEIMRKVVVEATNAIGSEAAVVSLREDGVWIPRYVHEFPQKIIGVRFSDEEVGPIALAAKTKKPVVINDAYNDKTVIHDRIKELKIRSALVAPLIVRDSVIGVISFFYRTAPVGFTETQVDFASKLAASISIAMENARLYEAEHHIADTLQEALLAIPERIAGVEFGSLYRSATEAARVGGDFYDIFELEHGKVGVLMGDVSGKGIEATALTSVVKNTIKAHAHDGDIPAMLVSKTNKLLAKICLPGNFITLFFGILDTKTGELTYCRAGHPPALIKRKSGSAKALDNASPIIGAFSDMHYQSAKETLNEGDILVLYTDGVTEARLARDLFGYDRLIEFVGQMEPTAVKEMPQKIFDEVMSYTGSVLSDDLAILAVSINV